MLALAPFIAAVPFAYRRPESGVALAVLSVDSLRTQVEGRHPRPVRATVLGKRAMQLLGFHYDLAFLAGMHVYPRR
jgi:hypothetical protein